MKNVEKDKLVPGYGTMRLNAAPGVDDEDPLVRDERAEGNDALPPGWWDHPIFQCDDHVANFGSQYNLACLSLGIQALAINTHEYGHKELEEPYWADHLIICFVFLGACMGMIVMGAAGDFIGPRGSMMTTCVLGIMGVAASSLIPDNSLFWENLAVSRLVVGFALGGAFPLAAANASKKKEKNINIQAGEMRGISAEADEALKDTAASKRVGWAFFWQSPGAASPYVIGLVLLQLCGSPMAFFRALLSLGILPNLYVFFCAALQTPERDASLELTMVDHERLASMNEERKLNMRNRSNWVYLIGTGGSWFIFDMTYYGIFLFAPELIMHMFGYTDGEEAGEAFGLHHICYAGAFSTGVGIFGGFAAVHSLQYLGSKRLNSVGFLFIGCAFSALAVARLVPSSGPHLQLVLFAILALSLNYGPNISTYVLPTRVFPKCVQSTFHGFSSACGKSGALTGTLLFPVLRKQLSIASIMFLCAGASLVGTLLTELFIPATDSTSIKHRTLRTYKASPEKLKSGSGSVEREVEIKMGNY